MKPVARTTATLAAVAAVCTMLVALTYTATKSRIADNRQAFLEAQLEPALGAVEHDGGLLERQETIAEGLPGNEPATLYRAMRDGRTVALLFAVTAMDGYAGPIRILIGVRRDGVVSGVRILEHSETPGLGDKIERRRSDWLLQFDNRSLGDPGPQGWALTANGGDFDQISGASVTSRAVVNAISATLIYFDAERERLLESGSQQTP